jgi:pimeloyl-ACP methyl ester carboxylesterase
MPPYVDLGGIEGYVEVHGAGEPVLLLHGGFCSNETWAGQIPALAAHYEVHAPERPGQGRTPDRPGPISFAHMVRDTVTYLDAAGLADVHVVGFSDGAITALLLALEHPDRVRSLVSISANLDPSIFGADDDSEPADDEASAPAPGESDVRAAYARLSPDGPDHADVVLEKLLSMWLTEPHIPVEALAQIRVPALVLAGDRDSIPTEHTVAIARGIPGAALCVVPDAGHMVIEQRPEAVNRQILEFLARCR